MKSYEIIEMKEILGNVYEGVACIAWSRVLREIRREIGHQEKR